MRRSMATMIINGSVIIEHLDSNDFTLTFICVTKHNCKDENIMIMKDIYDLRTVKDMAKILVKKNLSKVLQSVRFKFTSHIMLFFKVLVKLI